MRPVKVGALDAARIAAMDRDLEMTRQACADARRVEIGIGRDLVAAMRRRGERHLTVVR